MENTNTISNTFLNKINAHNAHFIVYKPLRVWYNIDMQDTLKSFTVSYKDHSNHEDECTCTLELEARDEDHALDLFEDDFGHWGFASGAEETE